MIEPPYRSLDDLRKLWESNPLGKECQSPGCPNPSRIHVLVESITITNVIVANDIATEIRDALVRARA